MDRDLARRQFDGLAGTGHRVRAATADLDRAVGRRPLRDRAGQPGECRLDRRLASGPGPSAGVSSPSRSSVVDDAPKQTVARYALRSPRWYSTTRVAVAEEDRQHARCERIERPAVPDALRGGQPPDEGDDVVRGRAGRLGDDEDAIEPGAQRRARHVSAGARRRAGSPRPGPAAVRPRPATRSRHRPPGHVRRRRTGRSGPSHRRRPAWSGR